MKKSYPRITASLILLSLLLSFLPAQARLLAEETGLLSQETEITSSDTETLLTSDMSASEMSTSEQGSSQSVSEMSTSERSPSQSSQEMSTLEAVIGKAEETTQQSQTVAEPTSPEFEPQAVAQSVETTRLSFKVDFKDGGFIFAASSRILPELALYRNIAGGEEELFTTNIEDYFRYSKQGNTYAYSSKTEVLLKDTNGEQYTYKIKPIFTADASSYVGDISYTSDEKDRYYTFQKEINITPGVDEHLALTAAADLRFTVHLEGQADRTLPQPVLKNLYQKGLMGKTDNFYENNKDHIALSLESETDSSKTYHIDYLPKFDSTSILGQLSFKYNYGLDLEDPETFRLLRVEPDRDRDLGNLYPNESDFFYTALEAFVFTKIWNDGEKNATRKVVPTFELWQKIGEKTSFVSKVFPDPIYDEENPDRIWKYHFEGLPLVDSKGEAIRYFVKETDVDKNYTVSDYNFEENILINSKAIDLNFSIVWNDNNQVKNRAPKGMDKTPIEILQNRQVYIRADVLVNPDDPADEKIPSLKTLGKAGENAYRVERLPIADNNLDEYDYTYRVKTEVLPHYNWFVKDKNSENWRSLTAEELTKGLRADEVLRADLKMPVRFTKTCHVEALVLMTRK